MKKTTATASKKATVGDKELAKVTDKTKQALRALVARLNQIIEHPSSRFTGVLSMKNFVAFMGAAKSAGLITKGEARAIHTELMTVIKRMR